MGVGIPKQLNAGNKKKKKRVEVKEEGGRIVLRYFMFLSGLSSLRQLSTLVTRPLRRIESPKQLARRMAALPNTYHGTVEPPGGE